MLTAYRFRLYPNEEQKEIFSRYFGCSRDFGLEQIGLNPIPSDRGEYKPVENPLTAELAKMKIKARSTSHDSKKQELYALRKLKLPIGAGSL
jgi:hypothetical protein